jgi:transcription-repair coupling factor (superfamily II helicase)
MADKLIAIAAARQLRPGEVFSPSAGAYDEFAAAFPYQETDDQAKAIGDVVEDLAAGRPMDRLVCGDVGFGKTEVALRAAFVAALEGRQVALVVPTTLLARQHYRQFASRFQGFPIKVRQLSRLVPPKEAKATKEGLKDGSVDIVVGTHAILAKDVGFKRLGLLIVDEEQHFGVAHKERLKAMKTDVHVLTLTATPIPRTLQLALTGVREMSLITTPPVDRLAVRTFVLPFDPVVVAEAIRRERFRGGQVYYVCPRIADLAPVQETLAEIVPEIKIAVAHGKLSATALEEVMTAFDAGQYDLLLSTNIIESGLDLPSCNTIIIHRADMFGLAQLYQLRGRIGRSKQRGYAYLTLPVGRMLTETAQKRLEVMQTLDSLGAGFLLASHDLDIRGAGNLLGEEQSGHIKEVGIELYQQMLEEAVAEARDHGGANAAQATEEQWSPRINVGIPVLIPVDYVPDLGVRLGLYRRAAGLTTEAEVEAFAAELIDRFGKLPEEVENLLATVAIKQLCKNAGVDRVEAGPKGAVISFHNDKVDYVDKLVQFITKNVGTAKLRPDQKLVYMRTWDDGEARLKGVRYLMGELSKLAA